MWVSEERLVPKLRFNGFNDDWKEVSLIEISEKIGDGMHATPKYVDNSDYYFINGNNLNNKNIVIDENTKCVPIEEYEKHKINFKNTILISINGTIGNLAFYDNEKVILGKSAGYINLNKNIDREFIFNYLQIGKIKYFFQSELTGTTIKNLSLKTLKNTRINLPNSKEQNKISNFLENIDKKIELLENEYNNYVDFKRSLMHQIFTQKLRFNEFDDEWKTVKLSNVAEIVGGGTPNTEVEEYWNGGIKWFTPSEIGKTKYVSESDRYISEEGLKNSSAKLLPKNTILLSSRATVGEISIALTECSTNQGFQSLITKNTVDNEFIYYLISTLKNEFLRRSSGSTFLEISKNEIKKIKINIPSLSEQKRISSLFSSIDNKIDLLKIEHEKCLCFKKSLLQLLFV